MSALWSSSYAGIDAERPGKPHPASDSSQQQQQPGKKGVSCGSGAAALLLAAPAAFAPLPRPPLADPHPRPHGHARSLRPPTAAAATPAGAGADAADSWRRRLDLEERYHLPFAPARVGWPDAPLLQLLAQQAEALGDGQLPLVRQLQLVRRQRRRQVRHGQHAGPRPGGIGGGGGGFADLLQRRLLTAAAADAPALASAADGQQQPPPPSAAGAGSGGRLTRLPRPCLTVALGGPAGDWLEVPTTLAPLWQQLALRPVCGPKPVIYFAICPEGLEDAAAAFLLVGGRAERALVAKGGGSWACHACVCHPLTPSLPPTEQ
jgi:hypothetical protein